MKEKDIIEKLKNHDSQAIKELVKAYQYRIINLCYRFLQDREDAEDTAQEVFIELLRSIVNFRKECKLSTWIYQIAVFKSLIKGSKPMEKIISLALFDSLHKRITYLKGQKIRTLAEYSKSDDRSLNSLSLCLLALCLN